MKKALLFLLLIFFSGMNMFLCSSSDMEKENPDMSGNRRVMHYIELYSSLGLEGKLDRSIFLQAVSGYEKIGRQRNEMLTIIDFSQPSSNERMFVIDMKNRKLVCSSVVSHGRNSGTVYAREFSNKYGSYMSSLGFYLTDNVYNGKNGYSLALEGLEKGFNDNARQRAIVVHGADYCNPQVARNGGMLGRSLGCPAIPQEMTKKIIDTIKGGSVMFIYADSEYYLSKSKFIDKSLLSARL